MSYEYQDTDLLIYKAVFGDNWDLVSKTFQDDPELRTKPINRRLETPLMIAVGTNQSHTFVEKLLSSISTDGLWIMNYALFSKNDEGDTALHYAAKVGNVIDAKLLVSSSSDPLRMALKKNKNGSTPLVYAAWLGRKKEMLDFLLFATRVLDRSISQNPTTSSIITQDFFGGDLISPAIDAGFLDIALRLVETYSKSGMRDTRSLQRHLYVVARKPKLFLSGSGLGFWGRLIYSLLPVHESKVILDKETRSQTPAHDEISIDISMEDLCCTSKRTSTILWFKRILQYLVVFVASPIKNINDMKIRHGQAKQLVKRICRIVIEKLNKDIGWTILGCTIATAIGCGNYEVIEECILEYPSLIWANFEGFYLFHEAIKQRQERVYNLVYQMTNYKAFVASHADSQTKENALHIAAKLAPPHRLNAITGAALQMQRELQWFEEIKSFVGPSQKEAYNKDKKTPRMVFTDEHKDLLKEGQEWMKHTACSSTVVAALIVTVAFAAVFTLPGGEKNEGKIAFMVFIISDAIALFSSATSVLMFLGILTSRYAEKDFLYTLPRRLTIGLVSLFLSLAATMITFSATLALVLQDKVPGFAAPLVVITSIPVVLFGVLQFPLLVDLVYATYGPSIFRKQNKRMIH